VTVAKLVAMAKRWLPEIILVAVLAALLWWGIALLRGDRAATKAAQAQIDDRVGEASTATMDVAVRGYTEHAREKVVLKERETRYVETIRTAPGADTAVPAAVHGAGVAAIRGLRDAAGDGEGQSAGVPPSHP
jgi:hypothetical protein